MPLTSQRRDTAIHGAILLLIAVLFSDILFLGNGLFFRDIFRYHFPMKHAVREAMLSGEFPYWNRLLSAGQPMAANPAYEVFYPPQWLVLLPSYEFGFQLHIIIHFAIGAIGMSLLLRSLGLRRAAIVFGTLSFTLGGFFLALANVLPFFFSVAWLPLIACYARRYLIGGDRSALLLAALGLAMQGLVGEPMTMAQTWLLLAGYALYRRGIVPILRAAILAIAGVGLSAIQILPATDHFRDSVRARGFGFEVVTQWSTPPVRILEMFVPHVLGRVSENGLLFWGANLYGYARAPFILSLYCGVAVAILFVTGLFVRSRATLFAAGGVALSYLLAIGAHTPLFRLMFDIGLLRSFRYPEKFAMFGMFIAIVFAASTFSLYVEGDERVRRIALRVAVISTAATAIVALISLASAYPEMFRATFGLERTRDTLAQASLSQFDLWRAVLFNAGALALLWRGLRHVDRTWYAMALLFVLADLVPFTTELLPRMSRQFFEAPPVTASLQRGERIFHEAEWYDSATRRKYFGSGANTPWIVRNGLFPLTPARWGLPTVLNRDYDETALAVTGEITSIMQEWRSRRRTEWSLPFMAISDARYRSGFRPFEAEMKRSGGDFRNVQAIEFVPVADSAPRYGFAKELIAMRSRDDVLALLTKDRIRSGVALVKSTPFIPATGRMLRVEETNNSVTMDVEAEGRAFLVAAITHHKYWTATIDGASAALEKVNIAYCGLSVPAGRHTIRLRYRNPLIAAGGALSLVTLLALCGAAWRGRSAHRLVTD